MNFLLAGSDNKIDWIKDKLLFLALTIELVLMIVEKSDFPFSYESYVFRLTFVLTMLALVTTHYSKKEWIIIVLTLGFTFLCYRITGNNDLLRYAAFLIACKEIDIRKTMKYIFWVMFIGYLAIVLLSITGVYGELYLTEDYGRAEGVQTRYIVGFGHPNTLQGAVFGLALCFFYAYGEKINLLGYCAVGAAFFVLYLITDSKTATFLAMFTVLAIVVAKVIEDYISTKRKLNQNSEDEKPDCINIDKLDKGFHIFVGVVAMGVYLIALRFSVWAAYISYFTKYYGLAKKIDKALTGRIKFLYYNSKFHKGAMETWTLFGAPGNDEYYFDMGWVRILYWNGIIPAILIFILLGYIIWLYIRKKDYLALIIFASLSVYTIFEATFVSAYIGRAFFIPMFCIIYEKAGRKTLEE